MATKRKRCGRLATSTRPQIVFEFITRDRSPRPIAAAIALRWPSLAAQRRTFELGESRAGERRFVPPGSGDASNGDSME